MAATSSADIPLSTFTFGTFSEPALVTAYYWHEHTRCSYVIIASLSVFIWDVLCHLRDDYIILFKHRISFPTLIYFLSRFSTLLYLIGYTIIQTTPLPHCNIAIHLATVPIIVALPASEFLLFLHVRAIYSADRIVTWFFTFLWLFTIVIASLLVATISGTQMGPRGYCTPAPLAPVSIGTIIIPLVNDTLLFSALVIRIIDTSTQGASRCKWRDRFKTAIFGASVSHLAKTLLQNGQQYFIATMAINLATLILFYADGGNFSLGFPSVMLMNLMASRLYRNTKLTEYNRLSVSCEDKDSAPPESLKFATALSHVEEGMDVQGSTCGSTSGTAL